MTIPSENDCYKLMELYHVSDRTRRHCIAVADVAGEIAQKLNNSGLAVNLELLRAAALLHDLRRDLPDHAQAAANILNSMGMYETAQIVAEHMDIKDTKINPPYEKYILFLADKLVKEDEIVGIEKRFCIRTSSSDELAKEAAVLRKNSALSIESQINMLCSDFSEREK